MLLFLQFQILPNQGIYNGWVECLMHYSQSVFRLSSLIVLLLLLLLHSQTVSARVSWCSAGVCHCSTATNSMVLFNSDTTVITTIVTGGVSSHGQVQWIICV